jgi:hypothetical protein
MPNAPRSCVIFSKNSRLVRSFMSCSLLRRPDRVDDKVSLLLILDECEQICVNLIFMRRTHAMRSRRASPSVRHTSTIGFRLREVEIRHLPLAAKVPLSCYSGSYPQENSSSPIASGLHFQDDFQFDRRTEWNAGDAKYKREETSLRRRHLESTPTPHRRPSRAQ